MSGESNFPSNRHEALALLYIRSQDLSGKSPEDIVAMYVDAYGRIRAKFRAIREERETS